MLTGCFARESIHSKLFRPYVSRFALLFLKPEKRYKREKTVTARLNQLFPKIDTIAAVHVDFMYRDAYVHSFSISNVIIEIAGPFLISLVAGCCLPSGKSTSGRNNFVRIGFRRKRPQAGWMHIKQLLYWTITVNNILNFGKFPLQLNQVAFCCNHFIFQPVSKKKKEKERSSLLLEKLKEELKQQEEHNQRVMASLKHERDSWLPASKLYIP